MGENSFDNIGIDSTYSKAIKFSQSHYENFPVASLFLPKNIRKHVAVVYNFARNADDIADEGEYSIKERIQHLEKYRYQFSEALQGNYANEFWKALHNTIISFNLSEKYFFDLLSAFGQDITKHRYETFIELLDYCKRSANPVGRIILEFFDIIRHDKAIEYSDAICTALQLTNFLQDVSVDYKKGRIYLPITEIKKYGVNESSFLEKRNDANFKNLLTFQVNRSSELFEKGKNLLPLLPKRLRFQISLTILGGEEILRKIRKIDYDVLNIRPKLSKIDYVKLLAKAFIKND